MNGGKKKKKRVWGTRVAPSSLFSFSMGNPQNPPTVAAWKGGY
jgi:hypothetical protein